MTIRPFQAWTLSRLLIGESVNGEVQQLPEPFRSMADYLARVKPNTSARGKARKDALAAARGDVWQAMLAARPDRDELVKALASVNPWSPPPRPTKRPSAAPRWPTCAASWPTPNGPGPGGSPPGFSTRVAADPGTGKTIMAADLARRLWFGLPWPDNQPNPLPKGTRTLWVPGDRHYGQLIDLAGRYGLPDEAMLFNAPGPIRPPALTWTTRMSGTPWKPASGPTCPDWSSSIRSG